MMLRLPFSSMLGVSVVLTALAAAACSSDESGDSAAAGPGGSSSQTSGNGGSGATGGASTTQASSGATSSSGQGGSAGGASGDTWANYAMGFFATYCIECHGAGDAQGRDYTTIDDVKAEQAKIRCGVASTKLSDCTSPPPKQFPIDNASGTNKKPDDAERARLVAWIEAGLPE